MMPGVTPWNGKKRKPVTLVRMVVHRKSEVRPSMRLPPSKHKPTTIPERIPMRLIATCKKVRVGDPKYMRVPPVEFAPAPGSARRKPYIGARRGATWGEEVE